MASFEQEKVLVERLLKRLNLGGASLSDPKTGGLETGVDVIVRLPDSRTVGVQVTEADPHSEPGKARAEEKRDAGKNRGEPYMWAQNNEQTILGSLVRSIKKKTAIAGQHSFSEVNEVWLLLCSGVPDGVVSTFAMTPVLSEHEMNEVSNSILEVSKYDRCFLLPIVGIEQAFYQWEGNCGWKKSVRLEDICEIPRAAYINSLHQAAFAGDHQEMDRLCAEECRQVLFEMREA